MEQQFEVLPALPIDSPLQQLDARVANRFSLDLLSQEFERFQFQFSYPICGHCSIDLGGDLIICTQRAGLNTNHPERGRCLSHDQQISIRSRSPYVSKLLALPSLQSVFEEFQGLRSQTDLTPELSLCRMALTEQIKRLKEGKDGFNEAIYRNILVALDQIRKLVGTIGDLEKLKSAGLTFESISAFLWQIQNIISQEIPDMGTRIRILERISTECKLE